ncbi:Serine/threonine-protein kinase B [Legionella steigerwaltii]|uniref:Serine/threonine-protein kinase B n=1 Tax=Legionella steigerwaltii TaxID=460 RepID=A0A378L7Q4_9GAMM|nr:DUF2169 domain-containing protein [Legionella steigerwaltii]KTD72043.1 Serine/threonine-protein kinase B [Legionella steigerwaltii]STY21709.1 Serine/threonine-protein kinase B [Legionella steigerwaltii]
MKIFKDKSHTVITFNYRHQGKTKLAVTIMAMFSFSKQNKFLSYADFWRVAKKTFNISQGEFIDLHMAKQRAEFFVKGSCYSYDNETRQSFVKVTLGNQEKQLTVWGDRKWLKDGESYRLSQPDCFKNIPITLNNAYGGIDHELNPDGRGLIKQTDTITERHLPNVELPGQPIKQPTDTPLPALLLPHSPTCKQQLSKFGTIDNDWLHNESPYYPKDIDWLFFNLAPADQQREHYFQGDEVFSCINMHPEKKIINGQLPELRVRCFYKRIDSTDSLSELNVNLDTLWLLPDQEKGILIWHGIIDTQDIAANDIEFIRSAHEVLTEAPKDVDYYAMQRSKPKEITPRKARDLSTMKPSPLSGLGFNIEEELNEITERLLPERKRFLGQNETFKIFQGKTPEESLMAIESYYKNRKQTLPAHSSITSLLRAASHGEHMPYEVNRKGMQFLDLLKKQIARKALSTSVPPEVLSQSKKLEQQIEYMEKISAITQFRTGAVGKSTHSREEIVAGFKEGKDFSGKNLSGIDLSDLDLSGINLSGCNLSECNLTRTRLTQADLSMTTLVHAHLSETVFAHANLTNALIKNASLDGANFSEGCLQHALIEDSSGKQCNFANSILNHARFKKCHFNAGHFVGIKANFLDIVDCTFQESDFSEARMQFANVHQGSWAKINFTKVDLSRALFAGVQLSFVAGNHLSAPHLSLTNCTMNHLILDKSQCDGLSCKGATLSESTFSGSTLTRFNVMNATVTQSHFINCNLTHIRGNEQTKISTSDFEQCNLSNSALLGGHYEELTLSDSTLDASQLMKSAWKKANFRKCSAKKFRFVNSNIDSCSFRDVNFFQGIFHSSIFENTEFNHCNLYSIAFTDCQRKDVTIQDCLVKHIALNEEEQSP